MAAKTDYVFTRDFLDNNRINLMHHLWTKTFGYLFHPKIEIKRALRVADIGAGTGIWLLDARDHLPENIQLDGFDISFDAAPPIETLPQNVRFQFWNVKEDIPEGLVNAFDVVHVRFMSFVLLNDEIPDVIAKIFRLLKPGGYIQWEEADMESLRFDRSTPTSKTDHLEDLFKLLLVQDPRFKPTWASHLTELFSQAGFVDVEKDTKDAPPHLAFQFHECGLMIHELIARKTKNERMATELQRLLPLAVEETRNGAYGTSLRFTAVARKP
ncbi:UMTA methyltransferase family protein [Pestalotiopsis sp. NC0098]|nr:UMTA methyltransferase family protein [Pestalotiopsis sp. NC0098]